MDIQLNLGNNTKKQKKPQKGKLSSVNNVDINFVKNPVLEGKVIARTRKNIPNVAEKSTFSFLKNTSKDQFSHEYKNDKPIKKDFSPIKNKSLNESEKLSTDDNFSLNIKKNTEKPILKANKTDSQDTNFVSGTKFKQKSNFADKGNKDFKKSHQKTSNAQSADGNKQPTFKQISALFKNNPEIPKIGQRHIKPVSEKLFSGKNFTDLNIHSFSIANLEKNMGLTQLTVVQQKATPIILNGRDVLVRSQTGSGKTLAYALPIVEGLQALRPKLKRQDGIKALVIVPTRELALQTYELFVKLVYPFTWIVPGYLIGGEKRKAEKNRLRKGFNILIGTPGRICDHLKHTVSLKLDGTRCLILDEADRLLDMGYEKDVASIVQSLECHKAAATYNPLKMIRQTVQKNHIRFDDEDNDQNQESTDDNDRLPAVTKSKSDSSSSPSKTGGNDTNEIKYQHELSNVFLSDKRQTVLLSATLTKAVETLAGLTMADPVFIDSSEDRGTVIADSITRSVDKDVKSEDDSESKVQSEEDDDLEIVPQEMDDSNENENSDEDENEESDEENEKSDEENEKSDEKIENSDENEESDDENESGKESSQENTDDSSDNSEIDSDKEDKEKDVYRGLKAFAGLNAVEEKSPKKKKSKVNKKEKVQMNIEKEASDSDSDYDFFAAVKESTVAEDTTIITDSGSHSNPFQNAIKSAIAQDEMVIPSSVTQIYIVIPMKLRLVTLSALIIERCVSSGSGKMLVFMATQDLIDYHCEILSRVLTGKSPKKLSVEAKKPKKSQKNIVKEDDDEDSDDANEEKPPIKTKKDAEATKEMKMDDDGDEYEYNYDGIPLEVYEEKMRTEKAFVDVEFFQLHGSMDQKMRTEVFKTFRKAKSGVLLCTDVAARGLDLPHVDCIVQYTGPISATDYVHRVGRTARAGNVGTAIMFLLPSEVLFVRQLEERRIRLHQEEMENTLKALNRKNTNINRNRSDAEQVAAAALQQTYEDLVEADKNLFVKACKAFTSWMRFYSTYPREARAAFDRKALHAGHAARALALRAAPREVAKNAPKDRPERPNNRLSNQTYEERKAINAKKKERIPTGFDAKPTSAKAAKRDRLNIVSEFDSGLEPAKKKKK